MVADTNTTARVMNSAGGSAGTSMYMASEQQVRSTMPIATCTAVDAPVGSVRLQ